MKNDNVKRHTQKRNRKTTTHTGKNELRLNDRHTQNKCTQLKRIEATFKA